MTLLTCAQLAGAIMAADAGAVLILEKDQACPAVTVRGRHWDKPVTLRLHGASIRHLTLWDVQGLVVEGGTFLPQLDGGMKGRGVTVRSGSGRLVFRDGTYRDCTKCLAIGSGSFDVLVERNEFQPIQDGVTFASATGITIRDNWMHNFRPEKTTCTLPDSAIIRGISKRGCTAKGGVWLDGHHADGVQFWGPGIRDIVIERNRIEGAAHGIGQFGSVRGVPPTNVRIAGNVVRTTTSWGIAAKGIEGLTLTGNDVGRAPGGTRKVQVTAEGSTGTICGNSNPDAPKGHPATRPC